MNRTLYSNVERTIAAGDYNLILTLIWLMRNNFLINVNSVIIIAQYAASRRNYLYHNDLLDELLKHVDEQLLPENGHRRSIYRKQVEEREKLYVKKQRQPMGPFLNLKKIDGGIIFIDSYEAFEELKNGFIKLNEFRSIERSGHYIFVYTGKKDSHLLVFEKIFRQLFQLYFLNINMLMAIDDAPTMFTYFPFAHNKCSSTLPEVHLIFNMPIRTINFSTTKPIFPNKLKDLNGCTLTALTKNESPLVILNKNKATGEYEQLMGIEGELLSMLAENLNFKVDITEKPFLNMTVLHELLADPPNITIGGFWISSDFVDIILPTISYMTFYMDFVITKWEHLSPAKRILQVITWEVQICQLSILLTGVLTIFLVRSCKQKVYADFLFGQGNQMPFTNLLSVYLNGVVVTKMPTKNFARYMLLLWMFYNLIMHTVFSGGLYQFLSDKRPQKLLTLKEAFQVYDEIYAHPIIARYICIELDKPIKRLDETNNTLETLIGRMANEKLAVIIMDRILKYSRKPSSEWRKNLAVLPQKVATLSSVFYMPKYSYLKEPFDNFLLKVLSMGLVNRLERLYLEEKVPADTKEPAPLTFWILSVAFYIYFMFLALSLLVFLLELMSRRFKSVERILNFFNC